MILPITLSIDIFSKTSCLTIQRSGFIWLIAAYRESESAPFVTATIHFYDMSGSLQTLMNALYQHGFYGSEYSSGGFIYSKKPLRPSEGAATLFSVLNENINSGGKF